MTPEQVAAAIRCSARAASAAAVTVAGLVGEPGYQAAMEALVAGVGGVRAQLLVQKAKHGEFGPIGDGELVVPVEVAVAAAGLRHSVRAEAGSGATRRFVCTVCGDPVQVRDGRMSGAALDRSCTAR